MRSLIELLLENIYIVIVVGGFLLSLLSKARKQGGGSRMPSFGGDPASMRTEPSQVGGSRQEGPSRESEWEEDSASRTYGASDREHERPVRAESPSVPAAVPAAYKVPKAKTPAGRAAPSATQRERHPARRSGANPLTQADELKRAVVMAEILGPPRSKRPLRRP